MNIQWEDFAWAASLPTGTALEERLTWTRELVWENDPNAGESAMPDSTRPVERDRQVRALFVGELRLTNAQLCAWRLLEELRALGERSRALLEDPVLERLVAEAHRVPYGRPQGVFLARVATLETGRRFLAAPTEWAWLDHAGRPEWRQGWEEAIDLLAEAVRTAPPSRADFLILNDWGQGKTHRDGWVITPEGEIRGYDEVIAGPPHKIAAWRWVLREGELALLWEKGSTASDHWCTVEACPAEPTPTQRAAVTKILDSIEEQWYWRRGMSGRRSPAIGDGWLHPETGERIATRRALVPPETFRKRTYACGLYRTNEPLVDSLVLRVTGSVAHLFEKVATCGREKCHGQE